MYSGKVVEVTLENVNNKTALEANDAVVTTPDVPASNAVLHLLDGVLVPSDVNVSSVNLLVGLKDFVLINALNKTSLLNDLTTNSVTLFAPTDAAFNKISDQDVLSSNSSSLQTLLLTHVG